MNAPLGCPKCKSLLPEDAQACKHCGQPLQGSKVVRRTALVCLAMIVAAAAACAVKHASSLPPAGELTTPEEEILVKPHSTYWKQLNPITKGDLTHVVTAGEVPVGINVSPLTTSGLTEELNDKMMASQTAVAAGKQGQVKQSVEAGQMYAVYIINETDQPAKVKLKTTLRWGTTQP